MISPSKPAVVELLVNYSRLGHDDISVREGQSFKSKLQQRVV